MSVTGSMPITPSTKDSVTAGLGQIEKREFLTKPPSAKTEAEIYDCIINWEREAKEQEKLVPAAARPILSKTIKGAVFKNIATGNIREYIETNEAIKDCEVLREEVLQMAMFNRTESNAQAQKPMPMDLNAVMDKLKDQLNGFKKTETEFNFGHADGKGGSPINPDINQATPGHRHGHAQVVDGTLARQNLQIFHLELLLQQLMNLN